MPTDREMRQAAFDAVWRGTEIRFSAGDFVEDSDGDLSGIVVKTSAERSCVWVRLGANLRRVRISKTPVEVKDKGASKPKSAPKGKAKEAEEKAVTDAESEEFGED